MTDAVIIAGAFHRYFRPAIFNGKKVKALQILGSFYIDTKNGKEQFMKGDFLIIDGEQIIAITREKFKSQGRWVSK